MMRAILFARATATSFGGLEKLALELGMARESLPAQVVAMTDLLLAACSQPVEPAGHRKHPDRTNSFLIKFDWMALLPENTCLGKKSYTGLYLIKQKRTHAGNVGKTARFMTE